MQDTTMRTGQARPWDRKVVDTWLVRMMEKGKLEKLLEMDAATAALIEPVSCSILGNCFWHPNEAGHNTDELRKPWL